MRNMDQGNYGITYWVVISTTLHIMAFIAVSLHALQRRKNASATVLWIFVAWSFPGFGPLLYISFGIDRVSIKGLATRAANQLMHKHRLKNNEDGQTSIFGHFDFRVFSDKLENEQSRKLNKCIDVLTPEHALLSGNHITPLLCGTEAYPEMLKAIRSAKHHIHLQSFIIHRDDTGRLFMDELQKKAKEGVQIRVLFDKLGSTKAYLSGMFRTYSKTPNMHIYGWTQANPLKRQFQINLRNHRKNLIIDGQTAFFGGINIASENRSTPEHEAIQDYHFKINGPLVHELQYSFLSDWFFITKEPIEALLSTDHFPPSKSHGNAMARIINSGPSALQGLAGETVFNAIVTAKKQILIITPYFVPPVDILKALNSAARQGVDVCIVVPEKNNHISAGMASKALYEELLIAGARIFHRKPPFIHAKSMIIDNTFALVGTANLDIRSLELNYETMVLFEDEEAISTLKSMMLEDMSQSTELNLNHWSKRPEHQKLAENLFALMTPIL